MNSDRAAGHAPSDLKRAFGAALRVLRRERRLSQERLAEASGLHRTYVSLIERGGYAPTIESVWALAEALGVAPAALIARAEEELRVADRPQVPPRSG